MSTTETSKGRKKRNKKNKSPIAPGEANAAQSQNQPPSNENKAPVQLPAMSDTIAKQKQEDREVEELQKMMDAGEDIDTPLSPLPMGPNPYFSERCLLCQCERTESLKGNGESDSGDSDLNAFPQMALWVCPECRKTVEEEEKRTAESAMLDQELRLDPSTLFPDLGSEAATTNGTMCTCESCNERRHIEAEHERETQELQKCWMELRHVVRYVYREAGTGLSDLDTDTSSLPDSNKMKELVSRLCSRDPHQLYQRLESQGQEYVIEMKGRLLKQLTMGHKTPPQAKQFVSMLLEEYSSLCAAAKTLASYLSELEIEHLKKFNLTWELHNKHLFQSIIYTDPLVQNSLPMLITQLRLGAGSKETYHEDTYPNILHRYLKFDDEMSVISVVWRDCEQRLEEYQDEQTALKAKQKMLKEDWEFFKQQRKLLEQQILKNKGTSSNHSLDAHFTETMRNIFQGKSGADECQCPNCNRRRCPCDECTISHIITCGIINPEIADSQPPHHQLGGYSTHDPSRYIIDVKPPSVSSTSSSSGSSSPLIEEQERPTLSFEDCTANFDLADNEIPEELDEDDGGSDSDDESSDEDAAENSGCGEATALEAPKPTLLKDVTLITPTTAANMTDIAAPIDNCDCGHCAQTKLMEQLKAVGEAQAQNQCQCHVCLQQSGKTVTTSLPQHLPSVPPASTFNLYPHIHGLNNDVQSLSNVHQAPHHPAHLGIRPLLYELHSPNKPLVQTGATSQNKKPNGSNFNSDPNSRRDTLHEHMIHAYGEWDNSQMLDSPNKFMLKYSGSDLLNTPLPPLLNGNQFLGESLSMAGADGSGLAHGWKPPVAASSPSAASSSSSSIVTSSPHPTDCFKNLRPMNRAAVFNQLAAASSQQSVAGCAPPHSKPAAFNINMNAMGLLSGMSSAATPMTSTAAATAAVSSQHQNSLGAGDHYFNKHNPFLHTHHKDFSSSVTPTSSTSSLHTAKQATTTACTHNSATSLNQLNTGSGFTNSLLPPVPGNNVSVGTSTPVCNDPDCDGNQDENYDSIDDSCSEQSSSASTSNQKDCNCYYCEVFGHNPPMTQTSRNFLEMRERLRLRLKKKKEQSPSEILDTTKVELPPPEEPKKITEDVHDQRGLEDLLKFINGAEENEQNGDNRLTAKAAKRARQRQRKAEEKARKQAEEHEKEIQRKLEAQREAEEAARRALEEANMNTNNKQHKKKKSKHKDKEIPRVQTQGDPTCLQSHAVNKGKRHAPASSESPPLSLQTQPVIDSGKKVQKNSISCPMAAKEEKAKISVSQKQSTGGTSVNAKNARLGEDHPGLVKAKHFAQNHAQNPQVWNNMQQMQNNIRFQQLVQNCKGELTKTSRVKINATLQHSAPPQVVRPTTTSHQPQPAPVPLTPVQAANATATARKRGKKTPTTNNNKGEQGAASPVLSAKNSVINHASPVAPPPHVQTKSQAKFSVQHPNAPSDKPQRHMENGGTPTSTPTQKRKETSPEKRGANRMNQANESKRHVDEKSPPGQENAVRSKKNKRKTKSVDDVDEIFLPKEDIESTELDESEREIEEFKRFCMDSQPIPKREKMPVNMNLKDIFSSKKKSGISCA